VGERWRFTSTGSHAKCTTTTVGIRYQGRNHL